MFTIEYATLEDKRYVCTGENLSESEFELKVRDERCYILRYDGKRIGVMVFNLIFDFIPFLTLFYVSDPHKGKGYGKQAMLHWENEMRLLGYKMTMTSNEAGEDAHHFYRKLGYKDMGSIIIGGILPYEQQTSELILGKAL